MSKNFFNKKENKGYVSVEAIIVAAIMLSLFGFLFLRWYKTTDDLSTSAIIGMQEQVNNMKDPNTGESFIDMANDTTTLLAQTMIKTKPFTFEKSLNKEQTLTFTVEDLNKIKNITASNGGTVEILSTEENEVTVKVSGGEITESVVISGEYIAYDEKVVTAQENFTYNDGTYNGTLNKYLYSGEASKVQTITEIKTYTSLSAIPTTNTYNVAGYSGILLKIGEPEAIVVSGTPLATKEVSKTVKQSNNNFDNTVSYSEGEYAGILSKSGDIVSTVIGGNAGDSKTVSHTSSYSYSYPSSTYSYNSDGYSGTLTRTSVNSQYEYSYENGYYESTGYYKDVGYYEDVMSYEIVDSYCYSSISGTMHNGIHDTPTGCSIASNWVPVYGWVVTGQRWVSTGQEWVSTGSRWVSQGYTYVYSYSGVYSGIITKPDTRVWSYEQTYSGVITKPDTRVYNYKQTYSSEVKTPDTRVYKYQGVVTRPESDTREYEHYYQYDVNVEYFEKQ